MNLGQNCDICWDTNHVEIPAFTFIAGVPLCNLHATPERKEKMLREEEEKKPPMKADLQTIPDVSILSNRKIKKSAAIAARGIRTAKDFAELMTTMMDDLLSGSVDVSTASAVCAAGDRLLRVAEMQLRYQPRNGQALMLGAPQEPDKRFEK